MGKEVRVNLTPEQIFEMSTDGGAIPIVISGEKPKCDEKGRVISMPCIVKV